MRPGALTAALLLTFAARARGEEPTPARASGPNVLLILIDDMGWMDVAFQGNERIATPHLDRFAAQGMRFTDAYAAAPVCSPTRASIMTGQAPARLRITNHLPDREGFMPAGAELRAAAMHDHLAGETVTLAEHMRAAGYATAFFGKWHLFRETGRQGSGDPALTPEAQGFDVNLGGCAYGGPPTFFDPYRIHNLAPRKEGEYLPDRMADETIAYLRALKSVPKGEQKPFFVCLWNYAVHWPMEAPAERIAEYSGKEGPGLKDARYAGMITALDASLGRIFTELDALEVTDDTLVVFTSDNGGYLGVADNRPLRLGKGYLYEGGLRVPMVVRWPGVVEAGAVCAEPVVSTDLFPTVLEAAGRPLPESPLDGASLVPLLRGDAELERAELFFHYPNYAWHGRNRLGGAVRAGRWKLIANYADPAREDPAHRDPLELLELYDLDADLGETTNLAEREAETAHELHGRLTRWLEDVGAAMPTGR